MVKRIVNKYFELGRKNGQYLYYVINIAQYPLQGIDSNRIFYIKLV